MFKSTFQKVQKELGENKHSYLYGPKGCGKAYTITVMFCICWLQNLPCLLLSPKSFLKDRSCIDLCTSFVTKHVKEQTIITSLMETGSSQEAWDVAIMKAERPLLIFTNLVVLGNMAGISALLSTLSKITYKNLSRSLQLYQVEHFIIWKIVRTHKS